MIIHALRFILIVFPPPKLRIEPQDILEDIRATGGSLGVSQPGIVRLLRQKASAAVLGVEGVRI